MFFKNLCLGRAWSIGVLAFIVSPPARATDRFVAIAPLMMMSASQLTSAVPVQTIFRFLFVHEGSVVI